METSATPYLTTIAVVMIYGFIEAWLWQMSYGSSDQHQSEYRVYGKLAFYNFLFRSICHLSYVIVPLIKFLWSFTLLCWLCISKEREPSSNGIFLRGLAVAFSAAGSSVKILGKMFEQMIEPLMGIFVLITDVVLFVRFLQWLPRFKASGESRDFEYCLICIIFFVIELMYMAIYFMMTIVCLVCLLVWVTKGDDKKHSGKNERIKGISQNIAKGNPLLKAIKQLKLDRGNSQSSNGVEIIDEDDENKEDA